MPVSDAVLRSMQMTAGNQAVGRAIAEGRIAPETSSSDSDVPPRDVVLPTMGNHRDDEP